MAPETAEVMETRRSEASTERYITLCATGKRPVPGVDPGHRPSLSRGTSNWKPSGKLPWELEKLTGNLQSNLPACTVDVKARHSAWVKSSLPLSGFLLSRTRPPHRSGQRPPLRSYRLPRRNSWTYATGRLQDRSSRAISLNKVGDHLAGRVGRERHGTQQVVQKTIQWLPGPDARSVLFYLRERPEPVRQRFLADQRPQA